ncbi:tetraspanin-33-like isoform X2 [Tachyglossus aculeatus]|uniref:tetraspanin-33-like isoform X2 n=1 Tax=Tachyglossus aculeatus TaxID=9261 RepID=UPI0018F69304|nr:tetraspanin-33-like isoform X2 [Tachyglossus aculeatus]
MRTNQLMKYTLFASCYLFWVASGLMVAVGLYAKLSKESSAVDTLLAEPSLLIIVVGVLTFGITFVGCTGALRDVPVLLKMFAGVLLVILILQIVASVVAFLFSSLVMDKAAFLMGKAIINYRDDLDLQNLIDYIQKKGILNTMCGYGTQNLKAWKAEDLIHTEGCLEKIVTWGQRNLLLIAGLAIGLLVLEIVVLCLAVMLIYQINFIVQKRSSTRKEPEQ